MKKEITIGSRESRLAVIQSEQVQAWIQKAHPELSVQILTMKTTGDIILNQALEKVGGKGLFVKELDRALVDGRSDLSVHSLKDVPAEENPAIPIGAFSERAVPADVLVLPAGVQTWDRTKPVGCASARRSMQLRQLYPDVTVKPVRGNVLTRLEKLDRGEYGALILAEAGLARLGLSQRISARFSPEEMVPAAGQGILAVQCRAGEYAALLEQLNDPDSALCARAERQFAAAAGGDCSAPVGCYARPDGDSITIYGFSGIGNTPRSAWISGRRTEASVLAEQLAEQLK